MQNICVSAAYIRYGVATISRLLKIIINHRAFLQKRPKILRSLLIVATPYLKRPAFTHKIHIYTQRSVSQKRTGVRSLKFDVKEQRHTHTCTHTHNAGKRMGEGGGGDKRDCKEREKERERESESTQEQESKEREKESEAVCVYERERK